LIRLLPSLLTASDMGVLFREMALIVATLGWLSLLVRRHRFSAAALGLVRPKPSDLGWGVAAAVLTLMISVSMSLILSRLHVEVDSRTAMKSLAARPSWLLLLIVLTATISEEAVFRAAMIPAVEAASGSTIVAMLISASIFAALHLGTYGAAKILVVFLPGLLMAGLFAWRRSLTLCIIAHALVDSVPLTPLIFRH
jgi:membrane protease YdiL (CAAX protease family)